ncbi:MAG TPA: adenylate/guanylate cyclase domain-containing protein [Actinomycetota bacterium]
MITCPSCGTENEDAQRFCGRCGTSLRRACPSCGADNPLGFAFCGSCGTRLVEEAAAPLAAAPVEERRWVTVVFADLSRFTSLSERMDPEDVRSLADRSAELMGREVQRFGGTVTSVMGDAVMAVFGAPVSHEDDPERAVRAALAMRDAVASSGLAPGGIPLSVHVGVNTGEVMAAQVGPRERRDYTVMGDTTNTAARLMSSAAPGEVLVGSETHRAAHRTIRFEPVDPVTAKGKQDVVEAWRALEPMAAPAHREVGMRARLIGRGAELELLLGLWSRTMNERRPHLVTLVAPPGMGKSRLAREVATRVAVDGARILVGRSLPYGGGSGYGAFAEQVRSLAGLDLGMDPDAARTLVAEHVRSLFGTEEPDVVAKLAVAVGIDEGEGSTDRPGIFLAIRKFVAALARERPTMLVFEDVHWADQTELDLMGAVSSRVHDVPLMVLCTTRPELLDDQPSWGAGQPAYTAVTLEPLPDGAARELAGLLLSSTAVGAADRLVRAGGGNPLFLEELAATVAGRHEDDHEELPTSVKAIITARLDLLPGPERRVIQDASVVGDVFWDGAVDALSGPGTSGVPGDALERLESRGLIRRATTSSIPGAEEFSFKHALIREIAYGIVPKATRRVQHAAVAAWLEERLGERTSEMAALLAHHWQEGADARRAVDYLLVAADHASRAWAKVEAAELLTRALALLDGAGMADRAPGIRLLRARAHAAAGVHALAVEDLEAALPHLEGTDRAEALVERAHAAVTMVDHDSVHRFAPAAAEAAEAVGDPVMKARALTLLGTAEAMQGHLDVAMDITQRAVDSWPEGVRARDPDYAFAVMFLGLYAYWRGQFAESATHSERAVDLGLEVQSLESTTQSMAHVAMALAVGGRMSDAVRWFERSVSLGLEWEGLPRFSSRSMNMWAGTVRELVMDHSEARRLSEEGADLARRAAFPPGIGSAAIDIMLLDLAEGQVGRAEQAIPGLWEMARATKGLHGQLFSTRLAEAQAAVALAAGRTDDAIEMATASVEEAAVLPRWKYMAMSRIVLGQALGAAGRPGEAAPHIKQALDLSRRIGHLGLRWRAAAELARVRFALGEDDAASAAADVARTAVEEFAKGLDEPARDRFLRTAEIEELLALH